MTLHPMQVLGVRALQPRADRLSLGALPLRNRRRGDQLSLNEALPPRRLTRGRLLALALLLAALGTVALRFAL